MSLQMIVPAPGSELGPCEWDCTHKNCVASRTCAAALCEACSKKIGYEMPFRAMVVNPIDGTPVIVLHEACWREGEMFEEETCHSW